MALQKCPACGYVAEYITFNHMRTVHGCATKQEFYDTYGKPMKVGSSMTPRVHKWCYESCNIQPIPLNM